MQVHPWRARRAITHVGIERIWPLMPHRLHFPVHHVSAVYRRKSYPSFSGTRRGRTYGTAQHSPLECKGHDHRFVRIAIPRITPCPGAVGSQSPDHMGVVLHGCSAQVYTDVVTTSLVPRGLDRYPGQNDDPDRVQGKDSSVYRSYCDRFIRHATRAEESLKLALSAVRK